MIDVRENAAGKFEVVVDGLLYHTYDTFAEADEVRRSLAREEELRAVTEERLETIVRMLVSCAMTRREAVRLVKHVAGELPESDRRRAARDLLAPGAGAGGRVSDRFDDPKYPRGIDAGPELM